MPDSKSQQKSSRAPMQQNLRSNGEPSGPNPTKTSRASASRATHSSGRKLASTASTRSTVNSCQEPARVPAKVVIPAREASISPPDLDQYTSASETEMDEASDLLTSLGSDASSLDGENTPWSQHLPDPESYAAPEPAVRADSPEVIEGLMEFEHNRAMEANWNISRWLGGDEPKRVGDRHMGDTSRPVAFHVRQVL